MDMNIVNSKEPYVILARERLYDSDKQKRLLEYKGNEWKPSVMSMKNATLEEQSINILNKYAYFRFFDALIFLTNSYLDDLATNNLNDEIVGSEAYMITELLRINKPLNMSSTSLLRGKWADKMYQEDVYILEKRLIQIKAKRFAISSKEVFNDTVGCKKRFKSVTKDGVSSVSIMLNIRSLKTEMIRSFLVKDRLARNI